MKMTSVTKERPAMASTQDWLTQLFPLRVLGDYDEKHGFFVAYCLETGSVTTADDMDTVVDMMKELLEDEVSRVMMSRNLANFFSTPAPFEVREKWTHLAKTSPEKIGEIRLDLKIPPSEGLDDRDTSTVIAVLKRAA
jgi:hypothetical protein